MKKYFELLPHTADLQIRVYGQTLKQLFCNALAGMYQSIKPKPIEQYCRYEKNRLICDQLPITHEVKVDAPDRELLLVDFLSEVLYLSDVHNEAYLDATIHELTDTQIKATVRGIKIKGFEVVEIKAVTYHDLSIKQVDGIWQANIVFDI